MENINSGIRYAGQMFGINTAADVAFLVAKAFANPAAKNNSKSVFQHIFGVADYGEQQKTEKQQQEQPPGKSESVKQPSGGNTRNSIPTILMANLLSLVGLNTDKLGALAINAIIMIAQAIGNALMSKRRRQESFPATDAPPDFEDSDDDDDHQPREFRPGSPFDWFLENPSEHVTQLIGKITDRNLPDKIEEMIEAVEEKSGGTRGDCLKLLMCKTAPFIWGMQKSISRKLGDRAPAGATKNYEYNEDNNTTKDKSLTAVFFRDLPDINEFLQHGELCEKRFSNYCYRT